MRRTDRKIDQLRKIKITRDYIKYPEGSVLVEFGNTVVLCNATVEDKVPKFKEGTGEGFVTAEYAMLPRSTQSRIPREINKLKKDGRGSEIQRLIGRSLRGIIDFKKLGERVIIIDCDVLQADGGTRTAAITGGFVALYDACRSLINNKVIPEMPINDFVAAVSVGIIENEALLDLCYEEDYAAQVDMNVVMTGKGEFIEVQGTAEEKPFSKKQLNEMLGLAENGIHQLIQLQKEVLDI